MRVSLQPEDANAKPGRASRVEASTRKKLRPAGRLARHVLLPPLLATGAVLCLLVAIATSFGQGAKASDPLARTRSPRTTSPASSSPTSRARPARRHPPRPETPQRAQATAPRPPLLLAVHDRQAALRRLAVPPRRRPLPGDRLHRAPEPYASYRRWTRHRNAIKGVLGRRPARYPHHAKRHPRTATTSTSSWRSPPA